MRLVFVLPLPKQIAYICSITHNAPCPFILAKIYINYIRSSCLIPTTNLKLDATNEYDERELVSAFN